MQVGNCAVSRAKALSNAEILPSVSSETRILNHTQSPRCVLMTLVDAVSGGDPGVRGVKGPAHFPEWGVTCKAVTPSFDAVLMSLFRFIYWLLSLIKFCFDLGPP